MLLLPLIRIGSCKITYSWRNFARNSSVMYFVSPNKNSLASLSEADVQPLFRIYLTQMKPRIQSNMKILN